MRFWSLQVHQNCKRKRNRHSACSAREGFVYPKAPTSRGHGGHMKSGARTIATSSLACASLFLGCSGPSSTGSAGPSGAGVASEGSQLAIVQRLPWWHWEAWWQQEDHDREDDRDAQSSPDVTSEDAPADATSEDAPADATSEDAPA